MLSVRYAAACAVAFTISGCSGYKDWWEVRYGPNPVLQAEDAENSRDNYTRVMQALITRSTAFAYVGPASTPPPIQWYSVAEAGFGYINEVCGEYVHELLKFEQRAERTRTMITVLDKTTAAILGQTTSHQPTISIVAQAFGLASGFTDAIRNTYSFQAHDAKDVMNVYMNLKATYVASAERRKDEIKTPTAAYTLVQGYLSLCAPLRLRAEMSKAAVNAQAVNVAPAHAQMTNNGLTVTPIAPAAAAPNVTLSPPQ